MSHPFCPWKAVLACSLLTLATLTANAQEPTSIKWRTNYAAAREESEKKHLPLVIYFTRPACIYCDKLEAITYRDARILSIFGEKVIPLKLNGLDHPKLAENLGVNLYPTLIIARPDAQYEMLKGYQEPDFLNDKITQVIATLKPNEAITKDFDNATKWEAAGEFARAASALRTLLDDNRARTIHKNAQELLQKIEKRAEDRFALAKDFQAKGKLSEALETLSELQQQFAGMKTATEAADLATKLAATNVQLRAELRAKRLRDLTTQAEAFYKSKDFIPCLDRCELINREFGDLPEARRAFAIASEIKNNPEWLQGAADVMTDRLGGIWLALADNHMKRGEPKRAEFYLQRIVTVFPGSRLAESAQIRLSQIRTTAPTGANEIGASRP